MEVWGMMNKSKDEENNEDEGGQERRAEVGGEG